MENRIKELVCLMEADYGEFGEGIFFVFIGFGSSLIVTFFVGY